MPVAQCDYKLRCDKPDSGQAEDASHTTNKRCTRPLPLCIREVSMLRQNLNSLMNIFLLVVLRPLVCFFFFPIVLTCIYS